MERCLRGRQGIQEDLGPIQPSRGEPMKTLVHPACSIHSSGLIWLVHCWGDGGAYTQDWKLKKRDIPNPLNLRKRDLNNKIHPSQSSESWVDSFESTSSWNTMEFLWISAASCLGSPFRSQRYHKQVVPSGETAGRQEGLGSLAEFFPVETKGETSRVRDDDSFRKTWKKQHWIQCQPMILILEYKFPEQYIKRVLQS